jgi:hypothetical protein
MTWILGMAMTWVSSDNDVDLRYGYDLGFNNNDVDQRYGYDLGFKR